MKRMTLAFALTMVLVSSGCAGKQLAQLQSDESTAQQALAATTQATAAAQASLNAAPAGAAGTSSLVTELASAQKVEQDAQLALNVAQAAINAAQKKDATDPALGSAVAAAVSAIPSPWTPILASLIPAALPLVVSIVQSVKLGKAHQTVQNVTQQLEQHKAALAALTPQVTK